MRPAHAVVFLTVLASCDEGSGPGGPDANFDPTPDLADTAAWIDVAEYPPNGFSGATSVMANLVTDAEPWPYDVEAPIGSCRYSTFVVSTCTPACDFDQVCIAGACASDPVQRSAGDLVLSGGGATRTVPFAMGYYHYEESVVFAPGTALTVAAAGAAVAAFTAAVTIPAPLAADRTDARLRAGEPFVLRWTPADPGSRIRLVLGADRGHALHRAALIECDLPDEAGGVTVPAATVDRFIDPANWSCGECLPHELRRYRRTRTMAGATPITLWASAPVSLSAIPER